MSRFEIGDSFILLLGLLCWLDTDGTMLLFLLAAALHEGGHYAALRLLGGRVRRFRLTAAGGAMYYWLPSDSRIKRALIAAAGPTAGLAAAYGAAGHGLYVFGGANLLLSLLNLLPVPPLDGGVIAAELAGRLKLRILFGAAGCFLCGAVGIWAARTGRGFGLLAFFVILTLNFQKNLQKKAF